MDIDKDPNKKEMTAKMQKHFDGISEAYYKIVDNSPNSYGYYHKKEVEFIKKEIPSDRILRVLDAGSGPGRHSAEIARKGHELVAVDFSKNMVEKTNRNLKAIIGANKSEVLQADVRNLPFEDGYFDVVINMEVLEHLPGYLEDCAQSIKEFHRLLKIGGRLIIEAPLRPHRIMLYLTRYEPKLKGINKEDFDLYYHKNPLLFACSFWEADIERLLLSSGFRVISRKYIRFFHEALAEKIIFLNQLESIFEITPIINKLCREVIWVCEKVKINPENK